MADKVGVNARLLHRHELNAFAMANGSIWVDQGLVDSFSDDELAIVLGHELAHFTHEHMRRQYKRQFWGQLVLATVTRAAEQIENNATRAVAKVGASMGVMMWQAGYSRELEEQADRVGMRYAYEAGYDVTVAPRVWARFRARYGDGNRALNALFGSHPRSSDREANAARELHLNYAQPRP
jgi:predicted Zn-dependent protease